MPWSKEQQQAINTYHKNILVAAAAGSGKTSVLVERVIQKIVKGICDINQILVVTFTNAAAAEMRERIATAITEKLSDKAKERQLALLNAASISTLHAFCQNIIRQNFHQIELDPKFRLAAQQEIDLLKVDVLEELFEQKYELDNNTDFLQFTDTYGTERGDESIYNIILKLYEYAQSQPFPEQWLKSLPNYFIVDENNIDKCPWLNIIDEDIQDSLELALSTAYKMKQKAIELNQEKYADFADGYIIQIEELQQALKNNSKQELYVKFNEFNFGRMVAPRKLAEEIKETFKNLRDNIKKIITRLQNDYFTQPFDEVIQDMPILHQQADILCKVTLDFAEAFAKAKADKSILDFSDLEHFTLKILAQEKSTAENLIPTATAKALQEKYNEIMVDEYQDTNGVQEAIIKLIASTKQPNLFFVGDVKQSIYKFRLAEPELFLEKYNEYPQKSDCVRIDLAQNFRSRKEIIDGVNFIFSQIMTPKASELSYGESEALYCGFPYPELDSDNSDSEKTRITLQSPIELILLDKENNDDKRINDSNEADTESEENIQGFKAEASCIAERIKSLMAESPMVFDKHTKSYRPLKWRDIVILLRSMQDKAQILAETLQNADIPVYASIETGYFQEIEVRVMISLLQIIDNPQQDIPLTAVLYSPIVNLSVEDLARVRLLNQEGNMYEALSMVKEPSCKLKKELKSKLCQFLTSLESWRDYARRHSVPELIWLLLNETGYYDYVGGMPEGLIRQANLRALYDRAATYEQTSFRGLFRFLRFIQKMQKLGNDLAVARSLGESEDVVRVMSIHKSKGLEFPVVILADTGKQFNLKDAQNIVLFHKKLGLGLYVNDIANHIRYHTLSRQAIMRQITYEYKAEEMRVLYVAMTRAREKLIITGSVNNIGKFAKHCYLQLEDINNAIDSNENIQPALPNYFITDAKSYLDWLGAAIIRHKDGDKLRELANVAVDKTNNILQDESTWKISVIYTPAKLTTTESNDTAKQILNRVKNLKPLPETEHKTWIDKRLAWQYPHQNAQFVPTKLSVTEIKRRFELVDNSSDEFNDDTGKSLFDETAFKRPQFLQQQTALTATEYGSLMHTVMQHLDFNGDFSDKGIKQQLDELVQQEVIAKEHVSRIYRKNIREFYYSDIGKRLRNATLVQRELTFNRVLPARKFYPEADENDTIFIQGIIDVLFEESDGLVLIDYKTDSCSEDEAKEKYKIQIEMYADAAQAIMQKPVKEKYLYLFHSAQLIPMQL